MTEYNDIINSVENDINGLESLISEPNGTFSESEITSMFKNNTSSAITNGINAIAKAVKETMSKIDALTQLETEATNEPRFADLKKRYAKCGQHLLAMMNMMREWN